MTKTPALILETVYPQGIAWGVSYEGPNPDASQYLMCENRAAAERLCDCVNATPCCPRCSSANVIPPAPAFRHFTPTHAAMTSTNNSQETVQGERYAYTGTCIGCGSVVSACVDEGDKKHISKFVARIVKDGDTVGRCPIKEVKLAQCTCS